MSPDTKAKLTFGILGSIYFAGGIEHGLSVPQGWLHWQQHSVTAPNHMVGLAVAAYSVATFFVAPFAGRWVDKPGQSKKVLILGACFHITGAVLDICLSQQWASVLARFISGVGGGADAVVLSETSRYTLPSRRTSAMALLVGARLLGYVMVPSLDILLWRVVLTQTHLPDRRTAALGLILVVMWAAVLLLTAAMYTELCRLQPLSQHSPSIPIVPSVPHHSCDYTRMHVASTVPSGLGDDYEVVQRDASFSASQPISIPSSLTCSQCSESSTQHRLAKSSEMIEEAEKCIQQMAQQTFTSAVVEHTGEEGMECSPVTRGHGTLPQEDYDPEDPGEQMSSSFQQEKSSSSDWGQISTGVDRGTACGSMVQSSETFDQSSYVKRFGVLPRHLQDKGSLLHIFYDEFIRHDVIALLAITMSGSFAHLCFQMMITPVTQRFLENKDLYVVLLFCLALVLVFVSTFCFAGIVNNSVLLLATCGLVWACGPQRRVLHVLGAGAWVLILGIVLFMVLLDHMARSQESSEANMAQISVCVCLYVVGLPMLLISATSVFTMLSDLGHHGVRQGVFHSGLSVAAILAPLWIEGTMTRLYLHHGVIIGLLLASLVTICCSGQHISALHEPAVPEPGGSAIHRHHTCSRHSAARQPSEQCPLLSS